MNESFIKVGSKSRTSRLELAQLVSAGSKLHCKPVEPVNRLFLKGRLSFGIQNNELPAIKTRAKLISSVRPLSNCVFADVALVQAKESIPSMILREESSFCCKESKQQCNDVIVDLWCDIFWMSKLQCLHRGRHHGQVQQIRSYGASIQVAALVSVLTHIVT